jgi:hypothetical protein
MPVALMGELRNAYKISVGSPEGDGTPWKTWATIILKWILSNWG